MLLRRGSNTTAINDLSHAAENVRSGREMGVGRGHTMGA